MKKKQSQSKKRSKNMLIPSVNQESDLFVKWIKTHWALTLKDIEMTKGSIWTLHRGETTYLYWVQPEVNKRLLELDYAILSAGLFLGYSRGSQFFISLPLIQKITKTIPQYHISITPKGIANFVFTHNIRKQDLRIPPKTAVKIEEVLASEIKTDDSITGIIVTPLEQPIGICKIDLNRATDPPEIDLIPLNTIAKYLRAGY